MSPITFWIEQSTMTAITQGTIKTNGVSKARAPAGRIGSKSITLWCTCLATALVVALCIPRFGEGLSFWFYLWQWIALATAMNLMAGMIGYLPFGFVAFFGIGAYATAISVQFHGSPVWLGIVLAGAAGAFLALLFAPTLRLKGVFFSIVSLSLSIVLKSTIAILPESIAGGSGGITITATQDPKLYYYLMAILSLSSVGLATAVSLSRFGLMLKAIRDDADAAKMIGINATGLRLITWVVSAIIAAFCGSLEALYSSTIDPPASFNVLISAKAVIYAALGGFGSVMGPVLGAGLMSIVDELVWSRFPLANLFILGAIISIAVLFFPSGLIGSILEKHPRFRNWLF